MVNNLPPVPEIDEIGSPEYEVVDWCEQALASSRAFLESQINFGKIASTLDFMFSTEAESGVSYTPAPKSLSRTRANYTAKYAEDLTASLTDLRLFFEYSTSNAKYQKQAKYFNKSAEDWYSNNNISLKIADMVRLYNVAGTGYGHLVYSTRHRTFSLDVKDPRNVYPVNPVDSHTLQTAQGVIIVDARTPFWVKCEYGIDVAPDINETTGVFGWITRAVRQIRSSGPLSRGLAKDPVIPATPTVQVRTMYLDDPRINETNKTLLMGGWTDEGKPINTWSYKVPPGAPIYPFKRLIVWTRHKLLYDGTSPYIHGMFPLLKLTLNPWPNCFLGKAPSQELVPLNMSMNGLLRVIDDHASQVAQPGVVADRNVSRAELNKFNSRAPGYQIKTNLSAGKGINIINPPPLDQSLWQHVEWIKTTMRELSGVADLSQLTSLGQMPSDDTIDKLMSSMTPANRLRSQIMEGFMKEFARMLLFNMAQFDTVAERVAKFGPDAITPEDFDYDPGSMIPDQVPDGDPGDLGALTQAITTNSQMDRAARIKIFLMGISFNFRPGSLLNSAAQQELMMDFLLAKMGYLSYFTLMERMGRMNVAPEGLSIPTDELSRLALQAQLGIGMIANAQGRKATNQESPQVQSGSTGEPTITTS